MTKLPVLNGLYRCSHESIHQGYNTDLEEMDSWEESEEVFLIFSPNGEVRALAAGEDASFLSSSEALERELTSLSAAKANGSWEQKQLDGREGYLLGLNLPYNVPTFWVSHGGPSYLFQLANEKGFDARRYYPQGGWGSELRAIEKRSF